MRVVLIRSNPILPDPRVEKAANSLLKFGHIVMALGWDRNRASNAKNGEISLDDGVMAVRWFRIKSKFGSGLANIIPLILFQLSVLFWLIANRKKYDCIHGCDFDTILPAWFCCKILKKKLVYDVFDYYVDSFNIPRFFKIIVKKVDTKIMNRADAVIITNESRIEQIGDSKPRKLVIVHNSPKPLVIYNKTTRELPGHRVKFAYFGILSPGRFLEEVLEIFKGRPDWELHIGGFGPLEEKVIEASKKYDNIVYYGTIPYKDVLQIEASCDIFFAVYDPSIPNHRYSSPNKLYEAMMLGKPIIVAKNTGIDILVEEEDIGKAIDYRKDQFERAVEDLLTSQGYRDIGSRARRLYSEKFSWDIMEHRLRDLYSNL